MNKTKDKNKGYLKDISIVGEINMYINRQVDRNKDTQIIANKYKDCYTNYLFIHFIFCSGGGERN